MIDRMRKISPHFSLGEMLPPELDSVPDEVVENLTHLAMLLEAVRWHFGVPVVVHDAYRPAGHNVSVGGVPTSDHLTGRAGDFHVAASAGRTWEENTVAAFDFIRRDLAGRFGQAILEDHRKHYGQPGKLWVHLSVPSPKHSGTGDAAAVLVSRAPDHYEVPAGEPTA